MFLGTFVALHCIAQEPTRWRGEQENGIYNETGLFKSWPETGPEIIWSYEGLGQGHSSPVTDGSYVYASGMLDKTGYLFKFDPSGMLISKYAYAPEFSESFYGTRSTPVIDGNLAYLLSGLGKLVCMDHTSGKIIWNKDLTKDFDGKVLQWGYNETVVIEGDILYCTPGGKVNNVVALDRYNGDLIWSCRGKGELSAYCTPLLFVHNGRKILATHTASHLIGIDAEKGTFLWSQPQPNEWSVHANTPIYSNGGLFYFSGYGQGAFKIKISQDGNSVSPDWSDKKFDSRIGGAVLVDGYIYGSGDYTRSWQCINWETGETTYESTELSKGAVIYSDGMLYCYSERGELGLVRADPAGFKVVSKTKVTLGTEQHWAHPMIYEGVLYLRHGNALIAYRIK